MHILNLRRLVFHSIFATNSTEKSVCGVADNTNTFILLLFVSFNCNVAFCFCQGITSLRDGITYHNMTLGSHLREMSKGNVHLQNHYPQSKVLSDENIVSLFCMYS